MKLDKKYLLNYIVSAIFIIVAVVFFYNLSAKIFNLDLLKPKHLYKLFKIILSGKIFTNLHNFSIFISFIGFIFVLIGGFKLSMDIEYKKDENSKEGENTINQTTNDVDTVVQNIENKETENTNENIKDEKEPQKPENKFAMYDKPKEENTVKEIKEETKEPAIVKQEKQEEIETQPEPEEQKQEPILKINEDQEREKVKNKIKEMINKMENKNKKDDNEEQKNINKTEPEKEQVKEKLLSKFDMSKIKSGENKAKTDSEKNEVLTAEKIPEQMNYETITEEQNMIFENVLIDAGFKLLSEIRIGDTGIDYLGISKEQIAIIQVDTKEGKWVANEDLIGDNKYPLWYSENGNKISPFYRVTETINTVKSLFKDIDIPIKGYICLTNNTIVNMDEAEEIAEKQNIKILKLSDFDGNEFIDNLDEEFEADSVTEPDEKKLDEMIKILEQAEIPE